MLCCSYIVYKICLVYTGQPDGCQGSVSCTVWPNPSSDMFSDITIILNNPPSDPMCVEGYKFDFQNQSQYNATLSSPSATFTINKELGLTPSENQAISSYDAENRTGTHSCSVSITSE